MAHNFMSTWTHGEKKRLLGYQASLLPVEETPIEEDWSNGTVDWRSKGKVNRVKDQAHCGSCWAFSATTSVESAYAIKHGSLPSLSEEQLVQCDHHSHGCNGGSFTGAFKYLEGKGQNTESGYPYTSGRG